MPSRRSSGLGRPVRGARGRAAYLAQTRRARPARPVRPRPDEGFAMSSPVALMSAAAVALAGLGFQLTGHSATAEHAQLAAAPPSQVERHVKFNAVHHAPVVQRPQTYVSVYNNSSISGLAGATAERIAALGWKVVG